MEITPTHNLQEIVAQKWDIPNLNNMDTKNKHQEIKNDIRK